MCHGLHDVCSVEEQFLRLVRPVGQLVDRHPVAIAGSAVIQVLGQPHITQARAAGNPVALAAPTAVQAEIQDLQPGIQFELQALGQAVEQEEQAGMGIGIRVIDEVIDVGTAVDCFCYLLVCDDPETAVLAMMQELACVRDS